MHGIIIIDHDNCRDAIHRVSEYPVIDCVSDQDAINCVPTGSNVGKGGITGNHNPMLHENLSRVVRWYKGRVTYEVRKNYADFVWQSRFHDHIIRSQNSYDRIADYIVNNPSNWKKDKFFG